MQTEMVRSHEMTEQMRQHRAHMERRARLWGKKPVVVNTIAVVLKAVEEVKADPRDENEKDQHVKRWRRHKAQMAGHPYRYVVARSDELGYSIEDMQSDDRNRVLADVRHRIMCEVKILDPSITFPQLGKLFHRDYTTCLTAVKRFNEKHEDIADGMA